jgi:hypothetical protein
MIGWAHTDDPYRPVVGLTVGYFEYYYAALPDFDWNLIGYVHRSEGPEVVQRYLEAIRGNLHRHKRQAPLGSSMGKLIALHPAPGWFAVYFDYRAGDSLSTMPPLVRKPLVGWRQYRLIGDELVGLVVLDTADARGTGIGDVSLLAGYFSSSQPLETQEEKIKDQWDAYVREVTFRREEWEDRDA